MEGYYCYPCATEASSAFSEEVTPNHARDPPVLMACRAPEIQLMSLESQGLGLNLAEEGRGSRQESEHTCSLGLSLRWSVHVSPLPGADAM